MLNRLPKLARTLAPIWLVTMLCLGQNASIMMNANIKRVGMRLACLCQSCKNTVGDCQMMGCGYAGGARAKIAQMQSIGTSDDQIVAKFVESTGLKALAVPPTEGFQLTAWLMPFAMIAVGLYAIYVYVRRMKLPVAAPASVSQRHQELAAKDLDDIL